MPISSHHTPYLLLSTLGGDVSLSAAVHAIFATRRIWSGAFGPTRRTQPYCCGASDLSSFFMFSDIFSGAHAIGNP